MSKVQVQCKGSGKLVASAGINAKRGFCPVCSRAVDLTGTRRARKHTRIMSKSALRRAAKV